MARSPTKRNHAISIALFALAFALRVIYLAVARSPFDNYNWLLAGSLLTDGSLSIDGVKTTAFEPLYPLFLAGARLLVGDRWWAVQVVQCAFGALGAPLLSWLTASLTGRPRAGVIAATMYAAYPLLIRYSGNISDATLTTVLIVGFAYAFTTAGTTPRAAAAGVWLGLTVLTRAMVLPLVPVGAALLWQRRNARAAAAFVAAAVAVAAPYAVRNYALNGWMLPTRSGLNLFLSNCKYTAMILPDYGPDILEPYAFETLRGRLPAADPSPLRERAEDEAYTRLAVEQMTADPAGTLRLKLHNVWYFFSPTLVPLRDPNTDAVVGINGQHAAIEGGRQRPMVDRLVYTASYVPVAALALAGIWIRRRTLAPDAIMWALVITFVIVHVIYFPTTRYRIPIEFVALFYSAVTVDWLSARRETSSSRKFGSETNQPAKAVFGTVPSTAVTRCWMWRAIRNRMASPGLVLGTSISIVSESHSRS
ncbi:MAG TPA: hypothetical protein VKH42_03680 [Vicinamibacterales bacterium]|nr:hypothetical protein [Vicinamibacterales bacterium]